MGHFRPESGHRTRIRVMLAAAVLGAAGWMGGCSPCQDVLTYETVGGKTYIYNCGKTLAVYNNAGNTFTEFWYEGVNLIGGFCGGPPGTTVNTDSPMKGHSPEYPFGHRDANGNRLQWEGFWSGFNYMDKTLLIWLGIPGNALSQYAFAIEQPREDLVVLHVGNRVPFWFSPSPLFECDVDYFVSPDGIGVRNEVTVFQQLEPLGYDDTGGQFIMTQVECDLDPAQPYAQANQPDLYYKLACNDNLLSIDPFPPYNKITPSNIYADHDTPAPPENRVHPIPNTALVPAAETLAFISPLVRPSRNVNLALRIDIANSTLPRLEYYCEYNGERDYLNFLLSPAIGQNRVDKTVPAGTNWVLYGDLVPWKGTNPNVLRTMPWLYE
jgi:hypothetical protein